MCHRRARVQDNHTSTKTSIASTRAAAAAKSKQLDYFDADEIAALLKILAKDRAHVRNDWRDVGMALHNSSNREAGFDLWKEWSRQDSSYDFAELQRQWQSFENGYEGKKLSVGSIYHWAKEDNPDQFHLIVKPKLQRIFDSDSRSRCA